jgi:hypothetical protein
VVVATGGRVRFYFPLDQGDGYCDMNGVLFPPPVVPIGRNVGKLQFEVQANTSRVFCTMHRSCVEGAFARDYQWQLTAGREAAEQQYLEPYGQAPCPQVPLLAVIQLVHAAIMFDFAKPRREVFALPAGVSHADVGRIALQRLPLLNWLDDFRTGRPSPFLKPNLFARPTLADLAQGLLGRLGELSTFQCICQNYCQAQQNPSSSWAE